MIYKKGVRFANFTDEVEILEREDHIVLAKITPNTAGPGLVSYDISSIALDRDGQEVYGPSRHRNGMTPESEPGSVRTPKSLELMRAEFNRVVEATRKERRAAKEAADRFSTLGVDKRLKVETAKKRRAEYESALAERLQGRSIETALDDKKTRELAVQIATLNTLINYIR